MLASHVTLYAQWQEDVGDSIGIPTDPKNPNETPTQAPDKNTMNSINQSSNGGAINTFDSSNLYRLGFILLTARGL